MHLRKFVHDIPLLPRRLHFHRQPTERQGHGDRQDQERANAELESPSKSEGDDEPKQHEEHRGSDCRHGDQDGPPLVGIEVKPLKPLRQPKQPLNEE